MEITVKDSTKKIELADSVFACQFNEPLVHQIVTAYLAAARAGTKAQKTRAEVSGGGKKPWKQKGTGQARAGTTRSPIWRSGGVTFAAKPRSFKQKVNRKMYQGAMKSILSELIRQNRMMVVEEFSVEAPKTKSLLKKLADMQIENKKLLIVSHEIDENLYFSARNLAHVAISDTTSMSMDPVSLVKAEQLIITSAAIKEIEGLLS